MKLLVSFFSLALSLSTMAQLHGPRPHPGSHMRPGQAVIQRLPMAINQTFYGSGLIQLKAKMQQQYSRYSAKDFELEAVIVEAKSQVGRGTVALQVGNKLSYPETVAASFNFYSNAPQTYSYIKLNSPAYASSSMDVWQIKLNGNIKVKSVSLILKKKFFYGSRPSPKPPVIVHSPRPAPRPAPKPPVVKPTPKPGQGPGAKPSPKPGQRPGAGTRPGRK